MRKVARKILVIDDLANRSHDCDLLFDQNLQEAGRYRGLIPDSCTSLIGPKYALLRPQFAAARQGLRPHDGQVKRLLVFCGGTDAGGETLKALEALRLLGQPQLTIDCVIGMANPHHAAIEAACRTLPNASLHRQVEDMAALMLAADLFIGAGGSISWERCCLGLPGLVVATADNQMELSMALDKVGAQRFWGRAVMVSISDLADQVIAMLEDQKMRRKWPDEPWPWWMGEARTV